MKNTIIIIVVLVILGVGGYYLLANRNSGVNPINTPPVSGTTVDIKNFSFNPSALTVKAGTKVTWINNDSVSHTITSDSGNLLNSPTLSPGQSFSFNFTKTGTEKYHCAIHIMMKGSVVVE